MTQKPYSLYVHAPWCILKCPYCDFNAYAINSRANRGAYVSALIDDFRQSMRLFPPRGKPPSIYFGGGTPSLISPENWAPFFQELQQQWPGIFESDCEITMEISPLVTAAQLEEMIALGVNRFSAGVQSFHDPLLRVLGREHRSEHSHHIAELTHRWPQVRWNLDIIYGLRAQNASQVRADLCYALSSAATHLSWYELTIEKNTAFARTPDVKATEEQLELLDQAGEELLNSWEHYEVSAYALQGHVSGHNLGYWLYDDYLGIGAGAHSKISLRPFRELRFYKTRNPKDYLRSQRLIYDTSGDITTDFLLSRLRLFQPLLSRELMKLPFDERHLLQNWLEQQRGSLLWEDLGPGKYALSARGQAILSDVLTQWLSYRESK